MAINANDVVLYESQRLTDDPDGGGRATGNIVVDGQVNNLFPDISRLDRTIGDVALRKVFLGIRTANQDTYLGAHAILSQPAADPRVRVLLFNTASESDERSDARTYIENYVVQGARAAWELLGNQIIGQRVLVAIQREEQVIPEIGEVYKLVNGANEQYVRITDVSATVENFTYESGGNFYDFTRRKLVLGISSALNVTFAGGEAKPSGTTTPKSDVFETQVADAAKYYGASVLTQQAEIAAVGVKVATIFENLVPSATQESAILDAPAGYNAQAVAAASSASISDAKTGATIDTSVRSMFLKRSPVPGTLSVNVAGLATWNDAGGTLAYVSGSSVYSLTFDPDTRELTMSRSSGTESGKTITATYVPGGPIGGPAETGKIAITLANRGYVYTLSLSTAIPRPGTLVVAYLTLGKWQEIRDNGTGVMSGAGTGSVNFSTGSVSLTLANLPDADTSLVYYYQASRANEYLAGNDTITIEPKFKLQADAGLEPGSVVINWTKGTAKSATDNSAGAFTGDATGWVNYATGEIELEFSDPPDPGTSVTVDADAFTVTSDVQSLTPDGGGVVSGTIPGAPLLQGSVTAEWLEVRRAEYRSSGQWNQVPSLFSGDDIKARRAQDDGAGGFVGYTGSVNYSTGAFTLQVENGYTHREVEGTDGAYTFNSNAEVSELSGPITLRFQPASTVHSAITQVVETFNELEFDLNDGSQGWALIPDSLVFTYGGKTHYDFDGVIYRDFDPATGAGVAVGSISATDAHVVLGTWESSPGVSVGVLAALYGRGDLVNNYLTFRAPGRPLRSQSVQITALRADTGDAIVGTSDANGDISTAAMEGVVDYETGIIDIAFTDGVDPIYVWPGSVRYNAVIQSSLPLDAELIGIDPVRLPADGRVPIFRDGGVIVLLHTENENIGTPVADQVVVLNRQYVADIWVEDSNGVRLDPAQYTVDLELGEITFGNPLTLEDEESNPLTTPLYAFDRIEHMSLMSDVQVSGDIAMLAPLAHVYPVGSIAASALLWGDVDTSVHNEFTQKTWNSSAPNWTGARIGDDTTASYNLINYPIEFTNQGAITEKWAIVFTSSNTVQVVGEQLGIIATGSITGDLAPVNPNTGVPYFIVRKEGWGVGWATANVLRFDTEGALPPLWMSRTTLPGPATATDDEFKIQARGDAD